MQFASVFDYCPFLFRTEPVPEFLIPAGVLFAIEWILLDGHVVGHLSRQGSQVAEQHVV
jgi:hypothetical protein